MLAGRIERERDLLDVLLEDVVDLVADLLLELEVLEPLATGEGVLSILKIQGESGKVLPVADFLRGFPVAEGSVFTTG